MMRTIFIALMVFLVGCATGTAPVRETETPARDPDQLLVVDCQLPGQVRKLGQNFSYLAPRRAVKTSAVDCEIRGGEYVAYDRANYATALKVWLPQAQQGNPEAQTYVGEIYEKGLGVMADYKLAQLWYSKAAEQGHARAQINLGYLYEAGLGVERDLVNAMNWYRKASGLSDAQLEYVSSVEIAQRAAAQKETEQLKEEVQVLRSQLEKTRTTLNQRKRNLVVAERELAALRQEYESSLQQTGSYRQDIENVNAQRDVEGRLQEARSEHERLLAKLAKQELKSDELRAQVSRLEEQISTRNKSLDRTYKELSQARVELARLKSRGGANSPEMLRLSTRAETLQATVATQQAVLARLETEKQNHSRLIEENEQLRQTLSEREQEIAALQKQLVETQELAQGMQTMQGQLVDLKQDQQRLTTKLAGQQLEASNLRGELSQAKELLSQRREELDSTKAELTKTQNELKQLRQSAEANKNEPSIQALESKQRDLLAMVETQQQEMLWLEREMQEQQEQLRKELDEAKRSEQQSRAQVASLQGELADTGQRLGELTLADERLREVENELQRRETEVERQRQEIAELQNELTDQAARLERSSSEEIVIAQAVGPTIELIDPPLEATRGMFSVNLRSNVPEVDVIGRVTPADRLYSFRVNDKNQLVEPNGVFRASIPVRTPNTPVSLVAIDKEAQRAAVDFLIVPKSGSQKVPSKSRPDRSVKAPGVSFGDYYALVIGNNDYQHMTNLSTAVNDAQAVADILTDKYGFKTKLLLNADRYSMLSALNELREQLTDEDNLLIYYAGHGELDEVNLRGYWLPVDAESDSSANWISNVAITDILNTMSAKHVLVVADSCYSGSMTRSSLARLQPGMSESMREKWFKVMVKTRVRAVLTSGGVKPVLDSGGGDHSVFAGAFLEVLGENDGILEGFSLYREVQKRVKHLSATMRVDQDPQYAPIKYAGHEAGEFFFLPSGQRIGSLRSSLLPLAGNDSVSHVYARSAFSSSGG